MVPECCHIGNTVLYCCSSGGALNGIMDSLVDIITVTTGSTRVSDAT